MSVAPASGVVALDILADLTPKRHANTTCDVQALRAARPDLAEQLDRALAAARYGDGAIAAWITEHGYPIGRMTVQRHRHGECVRCRTS